MAKVELDSPFGAEDIAEVPLANAPLARVLAQIRFHRLSSLVIGSNAANAFAEAMAAEYPLFNEQHQVAINFSPDGATPAPEPIRLWQLRSADEQWQVSFGDSFLAVDTAAYTSRTEFVARVAGVWERFVEVVHPPFAERVGVRYINRFAADQEALEDLSQLIRTEALGGVPAAKANGIRLTHSMHEALYDLDDLTGLQARWGILPPGAVLDPTLEPLVSPSWVLDLDAFRVGRHDVGSDHILTQVTDLAERAYRYFRWVVTEEFLARFGGQAE